MARNTTIKQRPVSIKPHHPPAGHDCNVTLKNGVQVTCNCTTDQIYTAMQDGSSTVRCPDGTIIVTSEVAAVTAGPEG